MFKKWICLLLTLALCCAPLSMALAEELVIEDDAELEEIPMELEGDVTDVPATFDAPVEGPAEEEPAAEDAIAVSDGEAAFAPGYWRVKSDDTPVYADAASEAAVALLAKDAAVLAVEKKDGLLRVCFESERGVVSGYVAAGAMEALSEDALAELNRQLAALEGLMLYQDNLDLPLTRPACAFLDAAADAEASDPETPETENEETRTAEAEAAGAEQPEGGEEGGLVSNATPTGASEPVANSGPSLTLSYSKLTIGVKEKCKILTATLGEENSGDTVTWSTSKKSVVKVDSKTGVLTGVKAGTATITAKAGSLKKTCKVTVAKAPKKVTLDKKSMTLSLGQSQALKATLPSKTGSTLTFTSSNEAVAQVEAHSGLVTGVKAGTATITVKTFNKKSATCKVTVVEEPDQVFLPETFTIAENEHKTIEASVVGKDNALSAASYTYTAVDGTGKVTVNASTGEVVGVKAGTATIRVTTHNGVSTHLSGESRVDTVCQVSVVPGPAEINLAAKSVTIGLKQSYSLSPVILSSDGTVLEGSKFTVSTSNKKKATVSAKGVVKGVKKGTVTITVKAFNGVKATCKVKVVNAPKKVSLSLSKSAIAVGETTRAKPSFPSGTMASCTYSSSNTGVATVDSSGYVTGVSEGRAVIKARTHNGKTASVTVKVTRDQNLLTLNGETDKVYKDQSGESVGQFKKSLSPGSTFQIKCQSEYGILGAIFSYQSDNTDVATVSSSGLVTAVEPGTANITVVSSTGTTAILRVTVTGTVAEKIAFTAASATVQAGRTAAAPKLKGTNVTADALSKAVYASGDDQVFTVAWDDEEDRWMLTGVNAGTATLTATAGSARAEIPVTVVTAGAAAKLRFEDERVYMTVGQSFTPRVLDDSDAVVSATLASGNAAVASVDENGAVTAVAEGSAEITATLGSLTAKMTVVVQNAGASVTLDVSSLSLGAGERYALKARVNGDGGSSKITYSSSDAKVASVTSAGVVIARSAGKATVTATEAGGASANCEVTVGAAPTALNVTPASVCERLKTGGIQLSWTFGDSGEAGTVTFSTSNDSVATVTDAGYVSFHAAGTAKISAATNNGLVTTVPVTVLPNQDSANRTTYRLFAAYSYHDDLPFTKRNASTMASVFGKSSIGGRGYTTKVMGNPSKSSLLNGISDFFEDTDDNDVSIVYLCSHGHNNKSSYKGYFMSLKGYSGSNPSSSYYMTAKEIFARVKGIKGSVVLILDSCYSGTFIEDMKGSLDAQGGRIAVLTAASNTRATYYNKKSGSVDFFTFFLLQGLGYNERDGWWNKNSAGKQGSYPGYLSADRNGDGNGFVTLNEFYSFACKSIDANIPSYMKKSWYWGDKKKVQKTRFYAGSLKNLIIYQPK